MHWWEPVPASWSLISPPINIIIFQIKVPTLVSRNITPASAFTHRGAICATNFGLKVADDGRNLKKPVAVIKRYCCVDRTFVSGSWRWVSVSKWWRFISLLRSWQKTTLSSVALTLHLYYAEGKEERSKGIKETGRVKRMKCKEAGQQMKNKRTNLGRWR